MNDQQYQLMILSEVNIRSPEGIVTLTFLTPTIFDCERTELYRIPGLLQTSYQRKSLYFYYFTLINRPVSRTNISLLLEWVILSSFQSETFIFL